MTSGPTGNRHAIKSLRTRPRLVALVPSATLRHRLVHRALAEARRARTALLVVDGTGCDAPLLAGQDSGMPMRWVDTDQRRLLPALGPWCGLPDPVAIAVRAQLATWLRPAGSHVLSDVVDEALEELAGLPTHLPQVSLFGWLRWLEDPQWRRRIRKAAAEAGLGLKALNRIHPRTPEGRLLKRQVRAVLHHDDVLDRAFCAGSPTSGNAWLHAAQATVVSARSTEKGMRGALIWLQALVELFRYRGPRPHLWFIDPPATFLNWLPLFDAGHFEADVRVVVSKEHRGVDLSMSFATRPAVAVDPKCAMPAVDWIMGLDPATLQRRFGRVDKNHLLFLHQRGAPADRAVLLPVPSAKPVCPQRMRNARELGDRLLRDRGRVLRQRTKIQQSWWKDRQRWRSHRALDEAMAMDRLTAAWRHTARRRTVPGADEETVEAFRQDWYRQLARMRDQVLAGTWNPRRYLRLYRPKASGGHRAMTIPSIRDSVLQTAVAEVLSEHLDTSFSDASFGYRRGRGAQRAVLRVCSHPVAEDGHALIADIATFFDTVDLQRVTHMLRDRIADRRMVRLVEKWLRNQVDEEGRVAPNRRGVPQGAPISPVLSNLYLTPLDEWVTRQGVHYVRYADDFIAICKDERQAHRLSTSMERFLQNELGLALKPAKTWIAAPEEGFDFLGFRVTRGVPRVQAGKVREVCERLQAWADREVLDENAMRELDSYVRGVRNYFDLGTDTTLPDLERWETARVAAIEAASARLDEPAALLLRRTEPFLPQGRANRGATTPGAYEIDQVEEETDESVDSEGPPTSWQLVDRAPTQINHRVQTMEPGCSFATGHLEVLHHGVWVSMESERVTVHRKKRLLFEVPIKELKSVRLASYGLGISTKVLRRWVEDGILVFFSEPVGSPWGAMQGTANRAHLDRLTRQIQSASDGGRPLVEDLIGAKIANQERLLRYLAKSRRKAAADVAAVLSSASESMRRVAEALPAHEGDLEAFRRHVFSVEGRAAQHYWTALAAVFGPEFPGRKGQQGTDPVNQALNYGYGILYAEVWRALLQSGLDPAFGYLHAAPGDRAALVFDVIEPFRAPAIDRALVALCSRGWMPRVNRSRQLTTKTRREIADKVSQMMDRSHSWRGQRVPLREHVSRYTRALAAYVDGGEAPRALRVRW